MFIPDPGFLDELREQFSFQAAMRLKAEQVRALAEPRAPRIMRRNPQAFEVQADEDEVRLANTDYGGAIAEWGSANNPPYAPLRTAARAAGMRLEEEGKS